MKKGNIIDLIMYRDQQNTAEEAKSSISEELQDAIENLIDQMRETGPLQQRN